MNQCDGCRRGLPLFPTLSGGEIHKGDGRWDLILCTKHLYESELGIADVWHEGSKSFYRAQLLDKLTPEQALGDPTMVCDHTWIDGRDTSTDGKDFCCKCQATK